MINKRHLPLLFFIGAAALKAILILLWRFFQIPEVARFLDLDPGPIWLAERATFWLFDPHRIAPSSGEAILFEVALVLAAGLEGLVVGLLLRLFFLVAGKDHPSADK